MFGLLHHLFHPTNCYALCSVARSGAHLLSSALQATHRAGRPLQYFADKLTPKYAARYGLDASNNFSHYVRGLIAGASTSNAVFGFRMEAWDVAPLVSRLQESGEFGPPRRREIETLRTAFPGLRCISLTRDDKLRQAVSRARAMQTNLWVIDGKKVATGQARFDGGLISDSLRCAEKAEELWAEFYRRNQITPLAITYEDLCADYEATVERVLEFLRLRLPRRFVLKPPNTVRQADDMTEDWLRRYQEWREQPRLLSPD